MGTITTFHFRSNAVKAKTHYYHNTWRGVITKWTGDLCTVHLINNTTLILSMMKVEI